MVQQVFGCSPDELRGELVEGLVPSRLTGQHAAHRAGYRLRPTPRPMGSLLEFSARRRDGTELAPMRSRRGPLVIATVVDITARTNLQEQLEQANTELPRPRADVSPEGASQPLSRQRSPAGRRLSDSDHAARLRQQRPEDPPARRRAPASRAPEPVAGLRRLGEPHIGRTAAVLHNGEWTLVCRVA
jgi:PAS domain S-box-containing protein